jgi:hypothetical protein
MNTRHYLFTLLLLSLPSFAHADYRTFTNSAGTSIEAKIISIDA